MTNIQFSVFALCLVIIHEKIPERPEAARLQASSHPAIINFFTGTVYAENPCKRLLEIGTFGSTIGPVLFLALCAIIDLLVVCRPLSLPKAESATQCIWISKIKDRSASIPEIWARSPHDGPIGKSNRLGDIISLPLGGPSNQIGFKSRCMFFIPSSSNAVTSIRILC
jgi:hypothetical protein